MRKTDTLLTRCAVFLGVHVVCIAVFLSITASGVMQAWKLMYSTYKSNLWAQGDLVSLPEDSIDFVIPRVLANGTLSEFHVTDSKVRDPAYYRDLASFIKWSQLANAAESRFRRRRIEAYYYDEPTGEKWAWSRRVGILHYNAEGELDGSLTDRGFVAGSPERSSFNDAVEIFYRRAGPPMFGFRTRDGMYRVDLARRTIERIASLPEAAFTFHSEGASGWIVYSFTPGRIYFTVNEPDGPSGSFEVPDSIRRSGDFGISIGGGDRVILRAEVPGSRTDLSVRYHVSVHTSEGDVLDKYTYEFATTPPHRFVTFHDGSIELHRLQAWALNQSRMTWFTGAMMPVSWWIPLPGLDQWLPRNWRMTRSELLARLDSRWLGVVVSVVLAALLALYASRRLGNPRAMLIWAVLVLILGIPAFLCYFILRRPRKPELCTGCGLRQSTGPAGCRRCGLAFPKPQPAGIEILSPLS